MCCNKIAPRLRGGEREEVFVSLKGRSFCFTYYGSGKLLTLNTSMQKDVQKETKAFVCCPCLWIKFSLSLIEMAPGHQRPLCSPLKCLRCDGQSRM